MGWFRKSEKSASAASPQSGADLRRAPRFQTAVISCMLGDVADLSSTGMRIFAKAQPPLTTGDLVRLELQSPKDELLVVGRVVRIQRRGQAGFEIGVEFQQLTPELSASLDSLARHGCIKGAGRRAAAAETGTENAARSVTVSTDLPDLYALLEVAPNASHQEVHQAFRAMARKLHPDLNPSAEAQTRFIELHKAYDVLKCPDKRRSYDAAWHLSRGNASDNPGRAAA